MRLIVFTDLDGTLLDHASYDYSPALPALAALKEQGIPLILASSKTGAEIAEIRSQLGADQWPAIVENGAGELAAGTDPGTGSGIGSDVDSGVNSGVNSGVDSGADFREYQKLRDVLDQLPASLRCHFRGFGDMDAAGIAEVTGLSLSSARLAGQRAYTEPGIFSGTEEARRRFCTALEEQGVSWRDGGRFLTLSFGRTKADGLREIAARLQARATVALGDAPNDRDMLLAATHAVVIRNDHAPPVGNIQGALYSKTSGPAAWNEAVLALLDSSV